MDSNKNLKAKASVLYLFVAFFAFAARPEKKGLLGPLVGWVLPVLPFLLIWWFLMKRMGGGPRGMMSTSTRWPASRQAFQAPTSPT